MNSKQLANVLIKILGLSLFVHAIPSAVSGIFMMMPAIGIPNYTNVVIPRLYSYGASSVIEMGLGAALIFLSRPLASVLLHDGD